MVIMFKAILSIVVFILIVMSSILLHEGVHWFQMELDRDLSPDCIVINPCFLGNSTDYCITPIYGKCEETGRFKLSSYAIAGVYYSFNEKNISLRSVEAYITEEEKNIGEATAYAIQFLYMFILSVVWLYLMEDNTYDINKETF